MPMIIIVSEVSIVVVIALLLFLVEPEISIIALISLGIGMGLFYMLLHKTLRKMGEQLQFSHGKVIQQVNQGLGSIKEAKILCRESYFLGEYSRYLHDQFRALHYHQVVTQSPRFVIELLTVILIFSVVIYLLLEGRDSQEVVATLSFLGIAAVRLMPSMVRITSSLASIRLRIPALNETYKGLRVYRELFATASSTEKDSKTSPFPVFSNQIELQKLDFTYEGASTPALNQLSLTIPHRKSVGFVGPSGAGKSTIVDIILGLLKADSGGVLVDGCDIHLDLDSWRRQIGYVPQSIYLIDDTIRANVAFGPSDDGDSEHRVWESLALAQLDDFVRGLPQGLDTIVGETGVRFSGGQRQRIGIARALYRNPQVLILDEATSALDNETERAFVQSIQKLGGKKTVILIAHRLSTVQHCDTIYFLSSGEICASGTYDQLLRDSAEFRQMAQIEGDE